MVELLPSKQNVVGSSPIARSMSWKSALTIAGISIGFGWDNHAGLISIWGESSALHILPSKEHWVWGKDVETYDCMFTYYGVGPLFLLVRTN